MRFTHGMWSLGDRDALLAYQCQISRITEVFQMCYMYSMGLGDYRGFALRHGWPRRLVAECEVDPAAPLPAELPRSDH